MNVKSKINNITNHYKRLVQMADNHLFVGITNEWLLDNYFLINDQKQRLIKFNKGKQINKNINMLKVIEKLLSKHNYRINEDIVIEELSNYQKENNYCFLYEELQLVPNLIATIIIDKISDVCICESQEINEKEEIDNIIFLMKKELSNNEKVKLSDYVNINYDTSSNFIVYFNEQIKEFGNNSSDIFKQFITILSKKNIQLRDIIHEEHINNAETSVFITNAFWTLKKVNLIQIDKLFNKVSKIERILLNDFVYLNMDDQTKNIYRNKLLAYAKKKKIAYLDIAKEFVKDENQLNSLLFPPINQTKRSVIYLLLIIILTFLLNYYLNYYLFNNNLISFIFILIPTSEIVIVILNQLLMKLFPQKLIPKMDYSKGIPNDQKTMVVIPTIIKNSQKIEKIFNNLEMFYLSNKTNNLYFTLSGDCSELKENNRENEDEIIQSGLKKAEELNKKYGKQLFYFIYRRRMYNDKENSWLGYERKRGGLLHFNDLLLNSLTEEEKNEYFVVHTFHDFKEKIKYVITLDVDTKLVLNSAKSMVAAMAHPLNKPVLNESKTKVINGYGLMQPAMSIDIESTNKSIFAQIYAGVGGFDPYNSITPNIYQDVFNEGSFVGKGIYDLNVFQTVLKNKFPDNIILSHDLIEGSFIRCANLSDVELVDDFPAKYLADASRRSRWARGDFQILHWLKRKTKNKFNDTIKNEISLIAKWKIFDNIRRGLLDFCLALILLLALINREIHPGWCLLFVLIISSLPAIIHIFKQIRIKRKEISVKYYNTLIYGEKALLLKTIFIFSSIPFNSYLYLNSFIRSSYRILVSKKNLLNWITAEDAEKNLKTGLINVCKQFWINYIYCALLIGLSLLINNHLFFSICLSILFATSPLFFHFISKDLTDNKVKKAYNKEGEYVLKIAKKTWNFFEERLISEYNYLIPDNYQLNRTIKNDHKTSPTNIGFSLNAIISAYELNFITFDKSVELIKNILLTIDKLKKWNGHLYNWYNIINLEIMQPNFISSVDSGNFIASLIITKEFLKKNKAENKLIEKIERIIDRTDFSKLYTEDDVFSIGFHVDEERINPDCYNKFASESRILSYIAIAKGAVPSHHWFKLDKTLTTHNNHKGLVSWNGTAFEYFMPLIYMPSYENTLLDETYYFAFQVQKDYINEINIKLPWGISESAYNELDDSINYKYKAFGIPYLRMKEESIGRIVISPYSSILAIIKYPHSVIKNMKKLGLLGLEAEYGFYESYDAEDKTPVYSYYAHHQGMILSSITNYLKNGILQKLFMSDFNNQTFEILNKEKVQINSDINLKAIRYKKYSYEKEQYANDIRVFHHLSSTPELSVLSNSKYSLIINDRGNGFSRYRTIQLNRYRKITEQDYGMFLYIKDLNNDYIWSNTYAPMNVKPEKYEVVFNLDRVKYMRLDKNIVTTTEIVVAKTNHAEIRKITFRNTGKKPRKLELTSYMEPIICNNNDDISHRVFNSMFINTEYDNDTNSIIMSRKSRTSKSTYYLVNRLFIENPEKEYQYETDRSIFIGRGNGAMNPEGLNNKLNNSINSSLDPIISLRNQITIEKGEEKTVYLIIGFGKSKEQVMNILSTYDSKEAINEKAFQVATIIANVTNKMINITANDMRIYNTMLNYLYQTSKISINNERIELLKQNSLSKNSLWRFGISGDLPVIFVDIQNLENLSIVKELLHAFEYYKSKSIFVDLVFINALANEDAIIIAKEIEDEKYHMEAINSFHKIPGNIFIIERNQINKEEYILLSMFARMKIMANSYLSLYNFVDELQKLNTITDLETINSENSLPIKFDRKNINFFNEYGGFINNGKEYVIVNKNTPTIWSNVITNNLFGTIVTNNNCGFTYNINSSEYKLTSWTNDTLLNDLSEGVKINGKNINFDQVIHGFGYSIFYAKLKDMDIEFTTFVSANEPVKFYKYRIKNKLKKNQTVKLNYFINPTLGISEDKTGRHLLCEYDDKYNLVSIRNVYDTNFNHLHLFMSSTGTIKNYSIEKILYKDIESNIEIKPNEEKEIAFILGSSVFNEMHVLTNKYQDIKNVNKAFEIVKNNWQETLQKIQIKTPSTSFNYMINGWLLYQTISSRINAKAGYYQVGGAFGYRDQLQDAMNICLVHPEITRKQILINAAHQFESGDVLHWWHEHNSFGLRSQFKDDYLWLVYASSEYINITEDYNILNELIPYVSGEKLNPGEMEKGIFFSFTENKDSLFIHLKKAIDKSISELGENGLPLIGGGDWNDGMNLVGEKGKGTSVWLGFFLYMMIEKFINIAQKHSKNFNPREYLEFNIKLKNTLYNNAWDGEYYLRGFFDNGNKLGSKENEECKIDLISQCFAILTGIADEKQQKSILKAINNNLVDKKHKIIKLLSPPFENSSDNPGYIMNYPKGVRENGGQYTHATSWYIMSLIKIGLYDEAFNIFEMVNPIYHSNTKANVETYRVEPYVVSADIYSNNNMMGRGGWTWYTGSAAWLYKVGLFDIIGFNKIGNKLYLSPHIPSYWSEFEITYQFNDTKYNIKVIKDKKNKIIIDGKKIETKYILLDNKKKNYEVTFLLEENND